MSLRFLTPLKTAVDTWVPSDQSGLAWWYELDSGVTTSIGNVTALADKTVNGNDLTHSGVDFPYNNPDGTLTGPLNKSVSAATLGELAAVTDSTLDFGTGDFIIAFLVYLNPVNGGKISTKDTYAGNPVVFNGWYIQSLNTGTGIKFGTQDFPTNYEIDSGVTTVSTWIPWIFTRVNGLVRMYADNVEQSNYTESPTLNLTNAAPLRIGLNGAWDFGANFKLAIHLGYANTTDSSVLRANLNTYMKNRGGL